MNVESILALLQRVRRGGSGWQALCPAHEDKHPSLSITVRDTKILLFCHAGCSQAAVLAALGVEPRELFGDNGDAPQIVAEYDYRSENGELLFQVVRYDPKNFRQRRPDGNGGWIWNLTGVRRVLYRLPDALKEKSILIVEGEKDCETAQKMELVATSNPGGAGKWRDEYSECLRGKLVTVIADADESGRKHAQRVAESLRGKVESLKVFELPGAKDLSDWVEKGGLRSGLLNLVDSSPEWQASPSAAGEIPIVALAVGELLTRQIRPREMLLDPILPEQGLAMLYSSRGIGKTFLSLGIAAAIASGGRFLRWTAPRARGVLYVDGELPAKTIQERIAMIFAGMEDCEPGSDMLRIISPDFQKRPMPDLATIEGQRLLEPHLEGTSLVVLDNLSALCRCGNENEGEAWLPVQEWALNLRRQGLSVLFDHHAGKNKSQRGTSRREDLLDTVITLKHSPDYNPNEGLRCEVHFEKTRSMLGDAAKPFEVRMESHADGRAIWTCHELEDAKAQQAAGLFSSGLSVRDVAEELGMSRSTAQRLRGRWVRGEFSETSHRPRV